MESIGSTLERLRREGNNMAFNVRRSTEWLIVDKERTDKDVGNELSRLVEAGLVDDTKLEAAASLGFEPAMRFVTSVPVADIRERLRQAWLNVDDVVLVRHFPVFWEAFCVRLPPVSKNHADMQAVSAIVERIASMGERGVPPGLHVDILNTCKDESSLIITSVESRIGTAVPTGLDIQIIMGARAARQYASAWLAVGSRDSFLTTQLELAGAISFLVSASVDMVGFIEFVFAASIGMILPEIPLMMRTTSIACP